MVNKKSNIAISETNTTPVIPATSDLDNVDKIRDILFGNQMRDMNQQHAQLEQRLASDIESLRKESVLQIESLQTFIESEIEILSSKLSNSEQNQHEAMDDLDGELKKSVKQIDKKITDTNNTINKQSSDMNQKLLKQSKDFNAEINSQINDARKRMDAYKQELSNVKVDKSILAEMLNAMAIQISAEDDNA